MGKFSRDKGARGEREFYAKLKECMPEQYHDRLGRNGNQTADGGYDSRESMWPFAIEIKRRANAGDFTDGQIEMFWKHLAIHCRNPIPVLAYRADRQEWKILVQGQMLGDGMLPSNWTATINIEWLAKIICDEFDRYQPALGAA